MLRCLFPSVSNAWGVCRPPKHTLPAGAIPGARNSRRMLCAGWCGIAQSGGEECRRRKSAEDRR
eukprot:11039046-Alexandrium_andersonii.AAC.1